MGSTDCGAMSLTVDGIFVNCKYLRINSNCLSEILGGVLTYESLF